MARVKYKTTYIHGPSPIYIRPEWSVKMVDQYKSGKKRSNAAFKRWLRPKLLVASYFLMVAISVSVLAIILGTILEG